MQRQKETNIIDRRKREPGKYVTGGTNMNGNKRVGDNSVWAAACRSARVTTGEDMETHSKRHSTCRTKELEMPGNVWVCANVCNEAFE